MADLDMSDVLEDPDFSDQVTVIRSIQTVGANGRAVHTPKTYTPIMNISPAGKNDIERLDDSQKQLRAIKAITKFRLQGPTAGYTADRVVWEGVSFLVAIVDPYTHFGSGFVEAILISTSTEEVPYA